METLIMVAKQFNISTNEALERIFIDNDPSVIESISETLPEDYALPEFKPARAYSG
jgi:hypothetical protein